MRFDEVPAVRRPTRPVADTVETVAALFLARVAATPDAMAFQAKRDGRWTQTTYRQFADHARAVASWLIAQGVGAGDKLTIVGSTRPEWAIADIAGHLAGAVTVGAYPTLTAEQMAYIVDHSDSTVAFVEGATELEKLRASASSCPRLKTIVVWDSQGVELDADTRAWEEVVRTPPDADAIDRRVASIDPAACAVIVYTSGTTGPPKGAMISHTNIMAVQRPRALVEFDAEDHGLSFLPMAHVAERILAFYGRINHGTGTAYASSIPAVLEELQEIRPTLFGAVPRIFEKAYDRIQGEVGKAPPAKRMVFSWADRVGRRAVDRWQRGQRIGRRLRLQLALADRIVFSRLRQVFGGRVKYFVTGAAPIPREVLEFFWSSGFRIFEAYGMTEATVLSHANQPGATRLGSVGRPVEGVECSLAEDGEILLRGPTIFLGYYKNEAATREAVDDQGWLHTGDIGKIDADGYLYIVDRKKHLIITAGGKNLTPANIENEIKTEDPLISHVHAHGDRRPYISALVTISPLEAIDWAEEHGLLPSGVSADELRRRLLENPLARPEGLDALLDGVTADAAVRRRVVDAVRRGNQRLARVERVKRVVLLPRELSVADEELTPTMKVRRKNVETKFAATFDRLYTEPDFGLTIESPR